MVQELIDMVQCPRCSLNTVETQSFCSRCGSPLFTGGQAAPTAHETVAPTPKGARTQLRRRPMLIGIIVVLLLAGVGAGLAVATRLVSLPPWSASGTSDSGNGIPTPPSGEGSAVGEQPWSPNPHPTLVGEAVFVGDELDWLILDQATLATVLPGTQSGNVSAEYESVGETEGIVPKPESCWGVTRVEAVYEEPAGFRSVVLEPDDENLWFASYRVIQYPTPELARAVADKYRTSSRQCTSYRWERADETWTYERVAERNDQDMVGIASSFTPDVESEFASAYDEVFVRHGNVVIQVSYRPQGKEAATALLDAVIKQVNEARNRLAERLNNGPL